MDANYTITEFYIEVHNLQVCGLPGQRHIEPPITAPREVAAVKTATKNSQTENLRFLKDQKVWNLWLQLYHHRIRDKEPTDELRQNFISDEMQLHTSTRSELNLIKSVIYIYIYNLFYILYFKPYFITILK